MVSLDVVNLFTKVLTNEIRTVVRDELATDPSLEERTCIPVDILMEVLNFCMKTTYIGMELDIYQQKEGLAMRSPFSTVLANEYFEEMVLWS